jgi:phosphinothricin acetyltransferase
MSGAHIRRATVADAQAINDILNYYVGHTTATFILAPQTLDDRLAWFEGRTDAHPVIAAEVDGVVVGWAALSSFRSRAAYAHTVELGVYLRRDMHRRGIGRALVEALLALARAAGHHVVVGGACGESTASIALLSACGFEEVARFREVGRKFDRWLDVVFFQRII